MENLAKEIITTTTEKYNEEGVIQEKITEVKERTYTVEPKAPKKEEEDNNDVSQGGAADNSATPSIKQEDIVKAAQQVLQQRTPVYTPTSTYQSPTTPQYNVVGRQTGGASGTTFPWETPRTY
ncbi:MAG: hypothetical protein MSA56_04385 [Clostridium sp.]|nr:hypothetical protein [Clostridium sp.]